MLKYIYFKVSIVNTFRISEIINRNMCSFSIYEDCTIFFPALLLNKKIFLVIKHNLLGEMTTLNFYDNTYSIVI